MGGIGRKAASNLRLRESGLLTDNLKDWKILNVDKGVYVLGKGEKVISLNVEGNDAKR
jgi:hypothetical protein